MERNESAGPAPFWSLRDFPRDTAATVAPNPAVQQFSTVGVVERQRIELWEEHNARSLVGLQARTLNGVPLEATEVNLTLGQLQFAHVAANPHIVERDAAQIARTPLGGVALYFTLFGESFFYCDEGVHLQRPGGLLVCGADEPFMRGFAHGLQEFVLTVPRELFEEISEDPTPRRPITMSFARIPGANAHAARLARLVRSTLSAAGEQDLADVESSALTLLRSIFSTDSARRAVTHRLTALDYIDRHLRDPRLSVGQVAASVGISERQLTRIFAETGTGAARVILEKRLDLARHILRGGGALSVGDVAAQCGFSSHAHFTRVFRERFEETPAQIRSSAGSAQDLTIPDTL
ncbi:AraC family transcriptional regulator [Lacisediminihabitans sp. H27-G8]|uniref:AraC family transcriptional regulator n=1 Tax=Lacisediminihabitans sp. H27-G8 TaxID=3111909 RepID=UPI0038FD3173